MFQNRIEAGKKLSEKLKDLHLSSDALIFSIPRGGVVVGAELAKRLKLPLYVLVVKKLGSPNNPELAIGALAPQGVRYIDWELVHQLGVEEDYLEAEIERKNKEIEEREEKFGIENQELRIEGKSIILVDDGIATGATTMAAIKYLKAKSKSKIILAVPVIAKDTYDKLKFEVNKLVALKVELFFQAVGQFYREFPQVTDEEVVRIVTDDR